MRAPWARMFLPQHNRGGALPLPLDPGRLADRLPPTSQPRSLEEVALGRPVCHAGNKLADRLPAGGGSGAPSAPGAACRSVTPIGAANFLDLLPLADYDKC